MAQQSVITPEMRQIVSTWKLEKPMTFDVEKGAIRKYAYVMGDSNPLWTDEARAKQTKHGGIIAPPVFLTNFDPFQNGVKYPFRALPGSASAGNRFEFYKPMRPGDTITVSQRLVDIYEKQGKGSPLIFVVDEKLYHNQNGELVAKVNWTRVNYNVPPDPKETGQTITVDLSRAREQLFRGDPKYQPHTTGPGKQVYFEDVQPGMEVPALQFNLTHQLFVRFFCVTNDWGTHHVDYPYAVAEGGKDCIAQGLLGSCLQCKLMTDWVGLEGTLRKLDGRYRAPGYPGDVWTTKGRVVKKYQEGGENLVDLEIWVENQDGVKVTPGSATVALPSRG